MCVCVCVVWMLSASFNKTFPSFLSPKKKKKKESTFLDVDEEEEEEEVDEN